MKEKAAPHKLYVNIPKSVREYLENSTVLQSVQKGLLNFKVRNFEAGPAGPVKQTNVMSLQSVYQGSIQSEPHTPTTYYVVFVSKIIKLSRSTNCDPTHVPAIK